MSSIKRFVSAFVCCAFFLTLCVRPLPAFAQDLFLPNPGVMVNVSPAFEPLLIKGVRVHPDNPLLFDFILDPGDESNLVGLSGDATSQPARLAFKAETKRLIKYFLACLTLPEEDLWVNLSPYEKDKMVPKELGQTELGRDMLAQDYVLKQLTASMIYPEKDLGKDFWDRVYAKARQMYGTAQVPVNTFNKVWVLADTARILEQKDTAYIVSTHLKIMLDEDYTALKRHESQNAVIASPAGAKQSNTIGSQIIREIILPELEKEVNTGKSFSALRQIFHSFVLASWYKKNLKQSILNTYYSDKNKIQGLGYGLPTRGHGPNSEGIRSVSPGSVVTPNDIYQRYLQAYKKGAFNYIKEESPVILSEADGRAKDPNRPKDSSQPSAVQNDGETTPRKYFSGGERLAADHVQTVSFAQLTGLEQTVLAGLESRAMLVTTALNTGQANVGDEPANSVGASGARAGRGTILVVDDEELIRWLLEIRLQQMEFQVVLAGSPQEALEKLESLQWQVDLLMTDFHMPGMTGAELIREVRKNIPDVPVILMSGAADNKEITSAGANRFLKKPFLDISVVNDAVNFLLPPQSAAMTVPKTARVGATATGAIVEQYKNADEIATRALVEIRDVLKNNNLTDKDTVAGISLIGFAQDRVFKNFLAGFDLIRKSTDISRLKLVLINMAGTNNRPQIEALVKAGMDARNIFIKNLDDRKSGFKNIDLLISDIRFVPQLAAEEAIEVLFTSAGSGVDTVVRNILEGSQDVNRASKLRRKTGVSFLVDAKAASQLKSRKTFIPISFEELTGRAVYGRFFGSTIKGLDPRKFGQKALLRPETANILWQGRAFDPETINKEAQKRLEKWGEVQIRLHYRLMDPKGSSEDLPGWQVKLTPKGIDIFFFLPATAVAPAEQSVTLTVTKSERPNAIEYYAPSYSKELIFLMNEDDEFDHDGVERGSLKYTHALHYVSRLFGLKSGFRVTVGKVDGIIKSGGFESSNTFMMGLVAIASILSGNDMDWGNIFALAVRLENNEFSNHTGGQGHLDVPVSADPFNIFYWTSGIAKADGSFANGYSAVVSPVFDGRNGRLTPQEGVNFIDDHVRIANAGKRYKKGVPLIGRLATLTNEIWTFYIEADQEYLRLKHELMNFDRLALRQMSYGKASGIVDTLDKLARLREEAEHRFMTHLIDQIQHPEKGMSKNLDVGKLPPYAKDFRKMVMEDSKQPEKIADPMDPTGKRIIVNPKFDGRAQAFGFIREQIENVLNNKKLNEAQQQKRLDALKKVSFYSWKEIDQITKLANDMNVRFGYHIAVFASGAGGMGAGLQIAADDLYDEDGSLVKTANEILDEFFKVAGLEELEGAKRKAAEDIVEGKADGIFKGFMRAVPSNEGPFIKVMNEVSSKDSPKLPALPELRLYRGEEVGLKDDFLPALRVFQEASLAQSSAKAAPETLTPGGIDLKASDLKMDVEQREGGIQMQVDQAMVARFQAGDFTGVEPVILSIVPAVGLLNLGQFSSQ